MYYIFNKHVLCYSRYLSKSNGGYRRLATQAPCKIVVNKINVSWNENIPSLDYTLDLRLNMSYVVFLSVSENDRCLGLFKFEVIKLAVNVDVKQTILNLIDLVIDTDDILLWRGIPSEDYKLKVVKSLHCDKHDISRNDIDKLLYCLGLYKLYSYHVDFLTNENSVITTTSGMVKDLEPYYSCVFIVLIQKDDKIYFMYKYYFFLEDNNVINEMDKDLLYIRNTYGFEGFMKLIVIPFHTIAFITKED